MTAESHEIVAAFSDTGSKTKKVVRPAPTRRINYRVATVEAEIRLTLDHLAAATPVYAGGTLVEGDEGGSTKVVWDFHSEKPINIKHVDRGSGYVIHDVTTSRYGFDSFGNLLHTRTTRNKYGRRSGDKEPRIIKSSSLSRKEQFELMLKLLEFRTRLDLTSINT